jgi:hypothetical protein
VTARGPETSETWRTEADDEWLATHRSTALTAIRQCFRPLGSIADATSHSAAGALFGGAPRNPPLKVRGTQAEAVRYAEGRYAYTAVRVDLAVCRICGMRLEEAHRLILVAADGGRTQVGSVRRCRACAKDSWLFESHMPTTRAARERDQRVVL